MRSTASAGSWGRYAGIMIHGVPKEYDDRTYIELLIIKHTLKVAEQMKTEGDFVSGMTDAEPPSCYAEV